MDAKNLFLDPDKQEKSAEKLSRDRKSAIGFRDATSGRKRRTYWIEAQKHAWTNSVVSPKKSPPRKSTKLNWFLCSHAIRRGGKRISGEKPLGKEHPKIYLQASETPKTGAHARNPGKGKEKRRKWKRKIDSHLVIFFCLFWRALDWWRTQNNIYSDSEKFKKENVIHMASLDIIVCSSSNGASVTGVGDSLNQEQKQGGASERCTETWASGPAKSTRLCDLSPEPWAWLIFWPCYPSWKNWKNNSINTPLLGPPVCIRVDLSRISACFFCLWLFFPSETKPEDCVSEWSATPP